MTASVGSVIQTLLILGMISQLSICSTVPPLDLTTTMYDDYDSTDEPVSVDYDQFVQQCQKADVRSFRQSFLPAIYAVITVLGFLGNGLVVITYIYFKRLKTMTDVYLLNLALADLLFLFTLPFWAVNVVKQWVFGPVMCKTVFVLYRVSFFSGMLLLMCISIDRYFSIVRAASAHRHRSKAVYYSKIVSVCVWLFSLVLSMPELLYSGQKQIDNGLLCKMNLDNSTVLFTAGTQLAVGFLIPFVVMLFCYCVIIKTLLLARNFEKNKAIKVVFAVVLVFLLFQLPYNSVMLIDTINDVNATVTKCEVSKRMNIAIDVTKSLAYVRCCLNPFLYAFIGVKFRNDLLKLMKEMGCMSTEQLIKYTHFKATLTSKRGSTVTDTDSTTTFSP
ncbi:C-C chemokine receptor type 7 [Chiloscyllium plagiosum]|uniref:C-C chemokine receptor type 7 n=1 Tax=Chiloscyllium plagiosum TaxID=36176 RepID=UPI001CB844A4|nr:C-C chemokine receptor type 7 [Chiloscyllium plagiosum]